MTAAPGKPPDRTFALGVSIALMSACSLGFIPIFARLSFDGGTAPWTLVLLRALFGLVMAATAVAALRLDLRVPRDLWGLLLLTGVGLTMISVGYMTSVAYIPVSLAAILFYTFPLIVLAAKMVQARRLPGPRRSAAYGCAFMGLALALGTEVGGMDGRGLALAMTASAGAALMYLAGERVLARVGMLQVAFYTHLVAVPVMAAATFGTGSFVTPVTDAGWQAVLAAGFCYMIGVGTQFPALKFAGAVPASLVSNAEPLVSLLVAAVVLGERLSTPQYLGGLLVIAAVAYGTWLMSDGSERGPAARQES